MPQPIITFTPNRFDYLALEAIREDFHQKHGSDLSITEAIRKAISAHAKSIREGGSE